MSVAPLNRTLDQELLALLRGASLECLVCGEFVLIRDGAVCCPECGSGIRHREAEKAGLQLRLQAG
jgi:Zn finger protein HypA/HybF involved in hydrogenase expression